MIKENVIQRNLSTDMLCPICKKKITSLLEIQNIKENKKLNLGVTIAFLC